MQLTEREAGRGGELGEGGDLAGDAAQGRCVAAGPGGSGPFDGAAFAGGPDALFAGCSCWAGATAQIPDTQPLTGWALVEDLAARAHAPLATTRWATGSVFSAVDAYASPELLTRILHQLPAGHALLFGRAELTPAA
ncbi:hypothetical protein ACFVFH_28295 [Streptomyces sp. NPDC057697]|uniref:hypothetical protein n=1 Tax=Streptomyces sp. NPDC057697 TaxID=3346219 RepID=UPI0036A7DCC4